MSTFLWGFVTFSLQRTFNLGRRDCVTSERNVYTVRRKKSAVGKKKKKKKSSLADRRSARFASRYFSYFTHFLAFSSTYCGAWSQANASTQSVSFPFTFQELKYSPVYAFCTFFTQYVVASPCFIPSPQSVIYTHQSYSNPNSKF